MNLILFYKREFTILLRKVMILFITTTVNIQTSLKSNILLLIMGLTFYWTFSKSPFISDDLNYLEIQSSLSLLLSIYCGLLHIYFQDQWLRGFFFICYVLTNVSFIAYWLKASWSNVLSKKLKKLKKYLKYLREKVRAFKGIIYLLFQNISLLYFYFKDVFNTKKGNSISQTKFCR